MALVFLQGKREGDGEAGSKSYLSFSLEDQTKERVTTKEGSRFLSCSPESLWLVLGSHSHCLLRTHKEWRCF